MSQPVGTNQEFLAATHLIHTNPLAITEYQMRVLRSTHPHFAAEAEREQAEARSKLAVEEHRTQQEAQRRHGEAARTLPPLAGPLREDDDLQSWWARHRKHVAPVWLVEAVTDHIYEVLRQTNQKNRERNAEIAALKARVAELEGGTGIAQRVETASLEARVRALEARPSLVYKGVWDAAAVYNRGMFVTKGGAVWHSEVDGNRGVPPPAPQWKLAVKKGSDGKDAK
jgi:hypothetical protein